MDWNLVLEFVRPELTILVVVAWCLGLFLKLAPKFKAEWTIPFIILGFSIIFTILYVGFVNDEGFTAAGVVSSIMQGIIIASIAVFGNNIFKQSTIKRLDDKQRK